MIFSGKGKDIGGYVRALREASDLTQLALAEKSGISEKRIRSLEAGTSMPKIIILEDILGVFGKDMADLLDHLYGVEEVAFDNLFEAVLSLGVQEAFEDMELKYQELLALDYSSKTGSKYKLSVQFLASTFTDVRGGDKQRALEILQAALLDDNPRFFIHEQQGKVRHNTWRLDLSFIQNQGFSMIVYRILGDITTLQHALGQADASIALAYAVMVSMDNPRVSVEVKRRLYATKMFNLSLKLLLVT